MAAPGETLQALNEVHGQEKPDDVGMGEWIWGALKGDFNQERSAGQIGFDMVVSLIPVVDTVCDVRDLCANVVQYNKDPDDKVTLLFIGTTVVGFFPEIGTVVKSVLRLVWVYLKPLAKHADDITNFSKLTALTGRACDQALPRITEYFQHNRVAKWATDNKLPDTYKFAAKTISDAIGKVDGALLVRLLDDKFDEVKELLQTIRPLVPSHVRDQIDSRLRAIDGSRKAIAKAIRETDGAIRTMLNVVAKKLDDHAWKVQTYRTNRGWVAPISETGAAKLINAAPPKWATRRPKRMAYPPITDVRAANDLMRSYPLHPRLREADVRSFSKRGGGMRADTIRGPAKLYRIIDPTNEGAGMYWITEAEYKALRNRDEWRRRFAVKPNWNQNGWVVEYSLEAGEELRVWRGPAASQELAGTDYYLEGGGEQIVFIPDDRDEMVAALPRLNRESGHIDRGDRRVEYEDITGEILATKLRARITSPRIKGPVETGWGAIDHTQQEAKRILLTAPIQQ